MLRNPEESRYNYYRKRLPMPALRVVLIVLCALGSIACLFAIGEIFSQAADLLSGAMPF